MIWDLVVVGSGPAGSSAAIGALTADPAASVLLLDRHDFPRDKCCGDAVLGAAVRSLTAHGVPGAELVRDYPAEDGLRVTSVRGVTVAGRAPDSMSVVPREVFDARLLNAARERGAHWRRQRVRTVRVDRDAVELDGGIRARMVIGADGVESVVRRAVGGAERRQLAVALRGYERPGGDTTDRAARLVLDQGPGLAYAWRFPIGPGTANIGYGHQLAPGRPADRRHLLASMHRLLPGVEVEPTSLRAHRLPLSTGRRATARGRLLLAGDAAALVNPITGEGIYYAVASGLAAGGAALGGPEHAAGRYRTELRRRFGRHNRHVALLAALIRSPAVLEAGLRAAVADPRLFADIAELGLATGTITPRLAGGMARELWTGRARATADARPRPPARLSR